MLFSKYNSKDFGVCIKTDIIKILHCGHECNMTFWGNEDMSLHGPKAKQVPYLFYYTMYATLTETLLKIIFQVKSLASVSAFKLNPRSHMIAWTYARIVTIIARWRTESI